MILAIDIGSSSAKAAIFDRGGNCLARAKTPLSFIEGQDPAVHEADATRWIEALNALVPQVSARAGTAAEKIACVIVSGNGPTIVPVDAEGQPLHNAITWMDRRAADESARILGALGRSLDPAYNLPKVLWFRDRLPGIYGRTAAFLSCPEFVCARLTGSFSTCLPAAGFEKIIWSREDLARLSLDPSKFPPFLKPGKEVGRVRREAAALSGLPEGIPVLLGGPDFIVSLIGTATTRPGRACDRAGTSEGINLCADSSPREDPRLLFMPHVIEPFRNVSGVISASGRAMSWFMDVLGLGKADSGEFYRIASRSPAGASRLLFLPYLSGERAPLWDPDARGAFIGLTLRHGEAEMARAVLESTGFAMRDVISVMESTGAEVSELRVTGGPAASPFWNQIKADITGKPIVAPRFRDAELLGDCCLALAHLGEWPSAEEAAEALVELEKTYMPDPSREAVYEELFGLYREGYPALRKLFRGLAGKETRPEES